MIKFYTSHCPKCKVLKKLMDDKNIEYEEIDDENIYLEIAEKNNIISMPFAEINERVVNTKELQNFIMGA
jgi:glutaredoxin